MVEMTGGCLCGRVRYVASGEPLAPHLCHCRDCQRATGSSFAAGMNFPIAAVQVEGELKTYSVIGSSGKPIHRHFCPNCGTWVTCTFEVGPGFIGLLAGTLDEPVAFEPIYESYCDNEQPWWHAGGERKRFPKGRT